MLALGIADRPRRGPAAREVREERVERADGAGEQRSAPAGELPFDAIDVDTVRDDQPRIAVERVDEPVEQKRDLAGMCRPDDERETHQPIVVRAFAAASLRADPPRRKEREERERGRPAADEPPLPTALGGDFGLRPRRATALPGIVPAQPSQRSAAFAPRRASLNVTRMTAPLPSSTSAPQLSHTRIVFRATAFLSVEAPSIRSD